MAISIGSKPDVPAATADIEEKGQEAAREADAKKNTQRVERKLADGEKAVTDGAAGKGISTLAVKDLLASTDSTALLEALLQAPVTQAAEQPKGDTAYETLAKLKDLLGKPNGLPVPEKAFEHADMIGAAAFPGLLSQEGTELLQTLASPDGATQASQLVEGLLSTTGIAARAGEMQVKGETTKATKEYVQKLQLMAEKFLNASAQAVPSPNLPAAVQKIFAANFPEISKAVKDFMKSAKPKDDDEIVIPDFAVLAFEQAIKPTVEKFAEIAKKTDGASGPAEGAQAMLEDINQATSPVMSALFAEVQMVKADDGAPVRQARWAGVLAQAPISQVTADALQKTPAGPTLGAPKLISAQSPGLSVANADLEALIYFVMMQGTALEGDLLNDKLKEMQETNAKKKAQREHISHMKKEKAEAEASARKEFEYLQAQGAIAPMVSFDDYMAWRQITWTPEGDALLQQPMPDLPDSLIFGPAGPPMGPPGPGAVGIPNYECNVDANEYAETYGLGPEDIAFLNSYYQFVQESGSINLGVGPGGLGSFDEFLANVVGITPGANNKDACNAFFDNTITGDTASSASTSGELSAARFEELQGMSKDDLVNLLAQACSQPPLSDDPAIQALIASPGIAALFASGGSPMDIMARTNGLISLIQKVAELAPKSEAQVALLTALGGAGHGKQLRDIGKELGVDMSKYNGDSAEAQPYSTYESYVDMVNGDHDKHDAAWLAEQEATKLLSEEPFASDPNVQAAITNILADVEDDKFLAYQMYADKIESGEMTEKEAMLAFYFAGNLYNNHDEDTAALLTAINGAAGNTSSKPAAILLAFCQQDGADDWPDLGQSLKPGDLQLMFDQQAEQAKAAEEAKTDEPPPDAPKPFGTTLAEAHTTAADADAKAQAQREEARKQREKAHAAAKEGVAHLQTGHGLEGEKGAITGSMAMFEAQVEAEQNKMDSLSDLSQTQSIALNQALDHRQKLLEALTNIMKKLSNTSDAIIQNTK